jgi:hypothetical protein
MLHFFALDRFNYTVFFWFCEKCQEKNVITLSGHPLHCNRLFEGWQKTPKNRKKKKEVKGMLSLGCFSLRGDNRSCSEGLAGEELIRVLRFPNGWNYEDEKEFPS